MPLLCRLSYKVEQRKSKSSQTFSVRPCSSVCRVTVDIIWRSWVRFPPRSKYFFFASCGSLFPFTRAIQYNTIQYNTIQYNTIQYNTIQYNTIQYNTIQYNTIQYNTIQYNTIQYNTIQYNTIQYNTIQYNTIQYNTIQYNTIQYNTIQYNTIQYNTIQYNTIQYNTIQPLFTLGSVYSTSVSGAEQTIETNNSNTT